MLNRCSSYALSFWDSRYKKFDITTSGHIDLPYEYNHWMYKLKLKKVKQSALKHAGSANIENANVVELGCGTGIYVKQWQNLGVKKLIGLDISPRATNNLQAIYPEYEFHCEDLGNEQIPDLYGENAHDIVTAIGVLVHILDDEQFRKALCNIASLAKKDGLILIAEYLCRGDHQESAYMKIRSISWYKKELQKAGLEIVEQRPLYFFMGRPYDTQSAASKSLLFAIFRLTRRLIRRFPTLMGGGLYCLDSLITPFITDGPSEKLLVCRKIPTGSD